ncbi:MAG: hypothetical protein ACQGVK_18015 [Myxococcota bacterium]
MLPIVGGIAFLALLFALARRDSLDGRSALRFAVASALGLAAALYLIASKPQPAEDHAGPLPHLLFGIASVVLATWSTPHLLVALWVSLAREPGRRWNAHGRAE